MGQERTSGSHMKCTCGFVPHLEPAEDSTGVNVEIAFHLFQLLAIFGTKLFLIRLPSPRLSSTPSILPLTHLSHLSCGAGGWVCG